MGSIMVYGEEEEKQMSPLPFQPGWAGSIFFLATDCWTNRLPWEREEEKKSSIQGKIPFTGLTICYLSWFDVSRTGNRKCNKAETQKVQYSTVYTFWHLKYYSISKYVFFMSCRILFGSGTRTLTFVLQKQTHSPSHFAFCFQRWFLGKPRS